MIRCTNDSPCLQPTVGVHSNVCHKLVADGARPRIVARPPLRAAKVRPLLDRASPGPVVLPGERRVVRFVVPGNPVPWERTVFDSRRSKRGRSMFITPKKTRAQESKIRDAARLAGVRPFAGPVKLVAAFYRSTRQRCDVDNLSKAVQDALNGIAYLDDSQIVALVAVKALDPANPRTEVEITEVA